MNRLPPPCPRCGAKDAKVIAIKHAYAHDPPDPGEIPAASVANFVCDCGHVFIEVQRPVETDGYDCPQ
jgi:hypothetical protein